MEELDTGVAPAFEANAAQAGRRHRILDRLAAVSNEGRKVAKPDLLDVLGVQARPARCLVSVGRAVEALLEAVEAGVPARSAARRKRTLVERAHEDELGAGAMRRQLEAQQILTPAELEQALRLELRERALRHGGVLTLENEAERGALLSFSFDPGRKPVLQLDRIDQRAPDLLRRMRVVPFVS
jgi:hypothetical protein